MTKIDDGGPAMPTTPVSHGYGPDTQGNGTGACTGMSLRDYFAAAALPGLIGLESDADAAGIVHDAYLYADAMLAYKNR